MSKFFAWLIGGAFALALWFLYKRQNQVAKDAQAPVGSASGNDRILADVLNAFGNVLPPSISDKTPVGPPRLDLSQANKMPVSLPIPIEYVPPAPPANNVQITPAFKPLPFIGSFGTTSSSTKPTLPTQAILPSMKPTVTSSSLIKTAGLIGATMKPPANSSVSPTGWGSAKSIVTPTSNVKPPSSLSLFRKL